MHPARTHNKVGAGHVRVYDLRQVGIVLFSGFLDTGFCVGVLLLVCDEVVVGGRDAGSLCALETVSVFAVADNVGDTGVGEALSRLAGVDEGL